MGDELGSKEASLGPAVYGPDGPNTQTISVGGPFLAQSGTKKNRMYGICTVKFVKLWVSDPQFDRFGR